MLDNNILTDESAQDATASSSAKQTTEHQEQIVENIITKKELPTIYPKGKQADSLYGLFCHYYLNHKDSTGLIIAYYEMKAGKQDSAYSYLQKCLGNTRQLGPTDILEICKRDSVLCGEDLQRFSVALPTLEELYNEYLLFKYEQVKKLLDTPRAYMKAEFIEEASIIIDEKYNRFVFHFRG